MMQIPKPQDGTGTGTSARRTESNIVIGTNTGGTSASLVSNPPSLVMKLLRSLGRRDGVGGVRTVTQADGPAGIRRSCHRSPT